MTLRTRMLFTGGLLHYGVSVGILAASWGVELGVVAATTWLACGRYILVRTLMPVLFPSARCSHCGEDNRLIDRWCCKDHYKDHKHRHILAFHCNEGHELGSIECSSEDCKATILIRFGNRQSYRQGRPLDCFLSSASQEPGVRWFSVWKRNPKKPLSSGLMIGSDLKYRLNPLFRLLRRMLRKSTEKKLYVRESIYALHMAILGGTGMGKSTLIVNIAKQIFERGDGATFLDPTGDLAADLLRQIPQNRVKDVLYIDVSDREFPFPFNLLHTHSEVERTLLIDEVLGIFKHLYPKSWGDRLSHQLRMALNLVLEIGGSLQDVYDLFSSPELRERMARRSKNKELKRYWIEEFPKSSLANRVTIINKLEPIVKHPFLGPILCAQECAFDADAIIRDKKIVIVNLATGTPSDHMTTILGSFIVNKVISAAYRQKSKPFEERVRHFFFVDEFQNFMHRASGFEKILSEARKYKLVLVIANQFVEQLKDEIRAAIFGNVGCLTVFRIGHRDARILKDEFKGVSKSNLMELPKYHCITRLGTHSLLIRTPAPAEALSHDPTVDITEHMQTLIGIAKVKSKLDTLDTQRKGIEPSCVIEQETMPEVDLLPRYVEVAS